VLLRDEHKSESQESGVVRPGKDHKHTGAGEGMTSPDGGTIIESQRGMWFAGCEATRPNGGATAIKSWQDNWVPVLTSGCLGLRAPTSSAC